MAPRPVILVHGILGQRHLYWNLMKRRLDRDGFVVHEAVLPYGMLGDMRIAAKFLADKIDATCRADGVDAVDLVCHSAGGLVARYYIHFLEGDKKVRHLVTLGSPHQGTFFSYLLPVPVVHIARQTRPGSGFLKELDARGPLPATVAVTNLWSPIDGVVVPGTRGVLEGAHNVRTTMGHWSYLWSQEAYRIIAAALRDEAPAG